MPEEAATARGFRFEHLRRNYTVVHASLRILLARYLDACPLAVRLTAGPNGKPYVDPPCCVQFNLSHSEDSVLFAFTASREIGVDLEMVRPLEDMLDIAQRFFCPEEACELASLHANEQLHAFFRCWTRKEAYLKAVGDGLRTSPNTFRVSLHPTEPARLIHVNGNHDAALKWNFQNIEASPSFVAAVAYSGPPLAIRTIYWPSLVNLVQSYRR